MKMYLISPHNNVIVSMGVRGCIYIIPVLRYLSVFIFVFKVSSKEIKLLLFDSSFMLCWSFGHPNNQTLEIYNVILWSSLDIMFRLPKYFPLNIFG